MLFPFNFYQECISSSLYLTFSCFSGVRKENNWDKGQYPSWAAHLLLRGAWKGRKVPPVGPLDSVPSASLLGKREKSDAVLGERDDYTGLFPVSPFLTMGLEEGEVFKLSSNWKAEIQTVLEHVNIYLIWLSTQSLFDQVMCMPPFSLLVSVRADITDNLRCLHWERLRGNMQNYKRYWKFLSCQRHESLSHLLFLNFFCRFCFVDLCCKAVTFPLPAWEWGIRNM